MSRIKSLGPRGPSRIAKERAYSRGYRIANTPAYYFYDDGEDLDKPNVRSRKINESIRHCRIFAMAYTVGWLNGRKSERERRRRRLRG